MSENNDFLLTLEEMAARLRVYKSWLYRQTKRHDSESIPRLKVGKYLRFNEAEVMAWVKKQNQTGNHDFKEGDTTNINLTEEVQK